MVWNIVVITNFSLVHPRYHPICICTLRGQLRLCQKGILHLSPYFDMLKHIIRIVSKDSPPTSSSLLSTLKPWWTNSIVGLENYWPSTNTEQTVKRLKRKSRTWNPAVRHSPRAGGWRWWLTLIQPSAEQGHSSDAVVMLVEFDQLLPTHFIRQSQQQIKLVYWQTSPR